MNQSVTERYGGNCEVAVRASLQVQQSRITSVLTEPQRALLSTISAGHDVIITAEKELGTKAQIPELGSDPVSKSKVKLSL
jgi:talin